jgi:hypothetical protein
MVSIIFNILFLCLIGSIYGYIADHLYFNIVTLAPYIGTTPLTALKEIINAFISNKLFLICFILLFVALYRLDKSKLYWRTGLLILVISSFFMRGMTFHAIPGLYLILVLYAFVIGSAVSQHANNGSNASLFLVVVFSAFILLVPGGHRYSALIGKQFPNSSEFSRVVKLLTNEDDRIVAYSFQNLEYLLSDRLPASGAFFYLPWQEKYNEHPILGIKIDACQEIDKYRPKIMLIDKWEVWTKYRWDSYAGCIQKIIDEYYSQIPDRPYYVRKDILSDYMGIAKTQESEIIGAQNKLK